MSCYPDLIRTLVRSFWSRVRMIRWSSSFFLSESVSSIESYEESGSSYLWNRLPRPSMQQSCFCLNSFSFLSMSSYLSPFLVLSALDSHRFIITSELTTSPGPNTSHGLRILNLNSCVFSFNAFILLSCSSISLLYSPTFLFYSSFFNLSISVSALFFLWISISR